MQLTLDQRAALVKLGFLDELKQIVQAHQPMQKAAMPVPVNLLRGAVRAGHGLANEGLRRGLGAGVLAGAGYLASPLMGVDPLTGAAIGGGVGLGAGAVGRGLRNLVRSGSSVPAQYAERQLTKQLGRTPSANEISAELAAIEANPATKELMEREIANASKLRPGLGLATIGAGGIGTGYLASKALMPGQKADGGYDPGPLGNLAAMGMGGYGGYQLMNMMDAPEWLKILGGMAGAGYAPALISG